MTDSPIPETAPPSRNWSLPVSMGLAIGAAIGVAHGVQTNFEPTLGSWGAFGVSLVAAAAIGAAVSLVVHWLMKPRGTKV
jgi:hypothetical protein